MSNHHPLANEVRVASLIATQIFAAGITEDDEDFTDILSAETDILDRLRKIVRAARYVEAQSKALTEMQPRCASARPARPPRRLAPQHRASRHERTRPAQARSG